jgi:6-pyruvoyl-tetrahydropterin synthase
MTHEIILTPKTKKISGAHSLACLGQGHPCARKHGHTWWVSATFAGKPDPVTGILIDYEVVHTACKEFEHYDLDEVMAPQASTGENILLRLVDRFEAKCAEHGPHVWVVRVVLSEDPEPGENVHRLTWTRRGWELRTL